jgi:hypothetical protein
MNADITEITRNTGSNVMSHDERTALHFDRDR